MDVVSVAPSSADRMTSDLAVAPHDGIGLNASSEHTIADRLRTVAARHPDRFAVLTDEASWTYAQLATMAGGYAAALAAAGVGPGDRVGLLLNQGADAIAAMLGVVASGAAYVPLDPTYPSARLAYMRDHADVRVIVTERSLDAFPPHGRCLYTDRIAPASYPPPGAAGPDDPAYLLYTSGSTGRPKGVVQTHRGVLAGIANHIHNFRITPEDRISVLASFSHDMAVSDLYGALLAGAAIVPIDVRRHGLPHLIERLDAHRVTVYHSTPTLFRYLVDSIGPDRRLPSVRAVLVGGEEATISDLRRARLHFAPGCVFVNGYGATEATFVAQYHVGPEVSVARGSVPVGYPLAGYEIELRDQDGVATAVEGEMVIRSRHVAVGYWREPGLTAERFGVDPDGVRWYRTGDLARRRPDGALVYLGRLDRQIKIRGHRVELGEVEAQLDACPGVVRAVAFARARAGGEQTLYAYVQTSRGSTLDPQAIRTALAEQLPPFAVPQAIVVCTELPLTPTGKVDVAAIPTPPELGVTVAGAPGARTATERLIGEIWREVLGSTEVAVDRNFFDLGGHSLLLATVHRRLEVALGRSVPLLSLYAYPTIASLAAVLDAAPPSAGQRRSAARMARRREAHLRRTPPAVSERG
jgi:amino acid adenylation domain-containing protein